MKIKKIKISYDLIAILILFILSFIVFKFWDNIIGFGMFFETWIFSHYWIFKWLDYKTYNRTGKRKNVCKSANDKNKKRRSGRYRHAKNK